MQRLGDIVAKDLEFIMDEYRDVTRSTVLQCGTHKITVNASLQSDDIEFTSDVSPNNAYSLELLYRESTCDDFNKCLKQNAIIYVDGNPFKIIDTTLVFGLRAMSLERKGGR